jgi:hypothetical protein
MGIAATCSGAVKAFRARQPTGLARTTQRGTYQGQLVHDAFGGRHDGNIDSV